MKNGMLIWNIALTILVAALLFLYFGKNKKTGEIKSSVSDTTISQNSTKIAYINMDSVQENYAYAKEILDDIRKQEQDNSLLLEKLSDDYNKKLQAYSQQDQTAGLQQLSEAHQLDLMESQKKINDRKQSLEQEYVKKVDQSERNLRNKIKDYLKEYNKDKKYAYIMSLEDRMFYYVDTVYDITKEVIQGLNAQHKNKKQ
jgi:outer membrane protein